MPVKQEAHKNNFFYLDVLSVLSAFAVVILHNNLIIWQYPAGSVWVSGVFIDSLFYFAVPIFFMISGVTLMDFKQRCTLKDYFIRRFKRAVVPFVLCSAASFLLYAPWSLNDLASFSFYKKFVCDTINYRYMNVYWFFIPLFTIYLALPALTQITSKVKTFIYMIIYGMITMVIVPFFCNLLNEPVPQFITVITSPLTGSFLLYVLIGYILHNVKLPLPARLAIYLAGATGFIMLFTGTLHYTPTGGPFSPLFRGYLNLPAMLQASALFLLLKEINWERAPSLIIRTVNFIKPHTLGIYLLHMHVINNIVQRYTFLQPSLLYRTIGSIAIFALCLFLSRIAAQIPFVSWALGKNNPDWIKRKTKGIPQL